MDEVDKVVELIHNDSRIKGVEFSGLAHDVADIVERHGYGVARLYLRDKASQRSLQRQAQALLRALEIIEKHPAVAADRKTARLIIKNLRSMSRR